MAPPPPALCFPFASAAAKHVFTFPTQTPATNSEALSRTSCKEACGKGGFPFYGLEWSIVCLCGGNKTTKANFIDGIEAYRLADDTGACDMPCPGNREDTCGGHGAIEIWEV